MSAASLAAQAAVRRWGANASRVERRRARPLEDDGHAVAVLGDDDVAQRAELAAVPLTARPRSELSENVRAR